MKNLDLNNYGIEEMNQKDILNFEGGYFIQTFKDFCNNYIFSGTIIRML